MAFNSSKRRFLAGMAAIIAAGAASSAPAFAASLAQTFKPRGSASFDHSAFDALLRKYVKPDGKGYNRVDYRGLKAGGAGALRNYLAAMQAFDPRTLSAAEAHAWWINLYNAKTLDVVIGRYPISSIKKINLGGSFFGSGPWSKKLMTVAGVDLSLDDLEHEIIRPVFRSALSHYALNCASYSCPNLATRAYTGANRNALMVAGAKEYVNHPRGLAFENGRITASKIYSWYAGDFGGKSKLKAHWLKYANANTAKQINGASISGYDYDWGLNDVR